MTNKQFDVNIGIGVAVEGIDQKSLENAKQKIKKALNNTDAQVKLDIDSESMKEFNATITALKKNIATLSFKDANSNLKEFVVNLKTGSVQAYDSAREAAAKYADRLIKLQSQLSKFKTVSPVDDKATKNIKQTQKAIEDLKKSMKANLPDDLFRSVLDTFDKTVLSIDEVKTRTGEASKRFVTPYIIAGTAERSGWEDAIGTTARFNQPYQGVFVYNPAYAGQEDEYDFYICDKLNHCIRVITPQGKVSTFAGRGSSSLNSNPWGFVEGDLREEARFDRCKGLAYDQAKNIFYIGDGSNRRIRMIAYEGTEEESEMPSEEAKTNE